MGDNTKNSDDPKKLAAKPKTARDIGRIFSAAKFSHGGFKQLIGEPAFRQEAIFFGVILIAFIWVGASAAEYLIGLILFLILAAVEALNTALENIVDKLSPEISEFGKHTKDLGSFAVFCLLGANGAFALYVIGSALY